MAYEYWALGDNPVLWDTATLGSSLTGITFYLGGNTAETKGTLFNGFKQTTINSIQYLCAIIADSGNLVAIGSKSTGSFSCVNEANRAITVHSIEPGSTAYEWMKSATGGKGIKYDFMQDLARLNPTNYKKLYTSQDITTKITAKANGYAPNSNTVTWIK